MNVNFLLSQLPTLHFHKYQLFLNVAGLMDLKINISIWGHFPCLALKFTEYGFLFYKRISWKYFERGSVNVFLTSFLQVYFFKSLYLAYLAAPRGQETEDCGSNLFQNFVNIIQISRANNKLPFLVLADNILALPTSCLV